MTSPQHWSVGGFITGWVARLLYLTSLTALIPFGALLLTERPEKIPDTLQYLPLTAATLLGLSALVLLLYHRSVAHTLASLGWMTLVPGIGSLVFMLVNREAVFTLLATLVIGFGKIEPLLVAYLENVLPKLWLFIIGYIVLGLVLIHIAGRMEHEHALTSQLRKLFGPRARIFRSH